MTLGRYLMLGGGAAAAYVVAPNFPSQIGPTYPQPVTVALERLALEPARRVEGSGMGSLTIRYAGADGNVVSLDVKRAGARTTVTCRVGFMPATVETSTALIDCHQPDVTATPYVRVAEQAMTIVVKEHLAATVAGRPYDTDAVAAKMIALVVVSRPVIADQVARNSQQPSVD